MESLRTIFNREDNRIGISQRVSGSPQKRVTSPNTGKFITVPGYEEDVVFQNDERVKQFDINKQVSSNWNWERYNNLIIKRVDRTYPAVPDFERIPKQVRNV